MDNLNYINMFLSPPEAPPRIACREAPPPQLSCNYSAFRAEPGWHGFPGRAWGPEAKLAPTATLPLPPPVKGGDRKTLSPGGRGEGEGDFHRYSLGAIVSTADYI